MSKLVVTGNSLEHIKELMNKDIYGIMLHVDKLSVNGAFYMDIDSIIDIDLGNKKKYVVMNKIMHNNDLEMVRECLSKLRNMDVIILFYDMGVYNISRELGMVDKLVIYQDHLNASILSNKFYNCLGINGSYVSNDITGEELLEIKNNSNMEIYFLGYGYAPIFYSRRYLIKNYLKFIDREDISGKYSIISDMDREYPIREEEYGTTIYCEREINLINYLDYLNEIDYIVMNSNMIDDNDFNLMVDKFINKDKIDDCYLGFFNTKTIFKVKKNV